MILAGLAAFALVLAPTVPSSALSLGVFGLWSKSHTAEVTDCGSFTRDGNNFCLAIDTGEPQQAELGVRFTTSRLILVTGVRVYRVDTGDVTGSLWSASGKRLATGTFAPRSEPGWQDLRFERPVFIWPGQTYVASYKSPSSTYAFEYSYFTHSSHRSGPITALQSVEGSGNGVYCYADCFPSSTYRDTNYWVTPVWLDVVE